jgi:hypothetical protein
MRTRSPLCEKAAANPQARSGCLPQPSSVPCVGKHGTYDGFLEGRRDKEGPRRREELGNMEIVVAEEPKLVSVAVVEFVSPEGG